MSRQQPPSVMITNESTPLLPQHQQPQQQGSHHNRKTEALGLSLMALSALGFSTNALLVKIGGQKFPSLELVFARGVIQGLLGLLGCLYLGLNPLGKYGVRKWLFFRGFTGSIGLALYFYSLTKLPLADATVVFFLSPTFTAIVAALVLKEPFTLFEGACAVVCLVGVTLISKPAFIFGGLEMSWERLLAIGAALSGAMFAAISYVTVRKVGKAGHFLQHTTYFGLISALMSPPLLCMLQGYVAPSGWYDYVILLLTGLTAFVGQCLLNSGLQLAPAGPGTLMRMNDVVFAFLFGILLLHEYPDAYSISGAVLIVSTTTALGVRKWLCKS